MPKAKSVKKALKKEVKKEVKAIKKAAAHAPKASKRLRAEVRAAAKPVVHGKGGYFGDLGSKIGGVIDVGAGLVKTIAGLGDYKVKSNTLLETGRPPQVRNTKFSSTVTGHPEYLCDIKSSQNFSIQKFPVNPGIAGTFPWLAPQTAGYEQYKPKGILFEYRPTCGDAVSSSNNAMGVVLMGSEYNVNLPDFSNKQQMEDHEYTTSIKPSECAIHPIECARSKTVLDDLFVRSGTESSLPDLKFYDLCNFYVATQGQQTDGVTIGEIWVTYEFEFLKPTLTTKLPPNQAYHWTWDSNLGVAPSASNQLQNLRELNTNATTGSGAVSITNIPAGKYLLFQEIDITTGTNTAGGSWTFTNGALAGCTRTNPSTHIPAATSVALASGSLFTAFGCVIFTATGSITGAYNIGSGTMFTWDLWIVPVGTGITEPSRRAVDYDPLAVMNRRLNDLYDRIDREEARLRSLSLPPWARTAEDEQRVTDVFDPTTPCSTPVLVCDDDESSGQDGNPLTQSKIFAAANLLGHLTSAVKAAKTRPSVTIQ